MWKRRAAWGLLLAAALGLYLFENNAGTRIILCTAVLLPLGSLALLFASRAQLSLRLEVPERLGRGERGGFALHLRSASRLPVSVRCALELNNPLTGERSALRLPAALGPRGEEIVRFSLTAAHCGTIHVRVGELLKTDALGLFARRLPCREEGAVLIRPELGAVELSLADVADFLSDSQRYSAQRAGYDPSETFRIREYVPGDPIRQIHWKLSQKTDRLLVRDFGLPVVERMLLLLETSSREYAPIDPEAMDRMLDLLFSVSRALLWQAVPHTVGWTDRKNGEYAARDISALDDLDGLEEALLSNPVTPGDGSVADCFARVYAQCAYAHVAVVTPLAGPELELLYRGNRVTALTVRGDAPEREAWRGGVTVRPVSAAELRQGRLSLIL